MGRIRGEILAVLGVGVLNCVACLYLPVTELKVTVPVIKGRTVKSDKPLASFKALIDENEKVNGGIKFFTNSSEQFLIVSDSGDVFLKQNTIVPDASPTSTTVYAEDINSGEIERANLEVNFVPLNDLDCDKVIEGVCFWTGAVYRGRNKGEANFGPINSPYISDLCGGYDVKYTLESVNNNVKLQPPLSTNNTQWSLLGTAALSQPIVNVNLTCTVENSIGPRFGTKRVLHKQFQILRYDVRNGMIRPQEKQISYYLNTRSFRKGDSLEPPVIFFNDVASENTPHYPTIIGDEQLKNTLGVECKSWPTKTSHGTVALHCRIFFEDDVVFKTPRKSFYLHLSSVINERNYEEHGVKIPVNLIFDPRPETLIKKTTKLYPEQTIKLFRTAAHLARVTQPNSCTICRNFSLTQGNKKVFSITDREGIVFVHDFQELKKAPEFIDLNVTWWRNSSLEFDEMQVRLVDEPNKTCANVKKARDWTFCAEQATPKECESDNLCAIATGGVNYFDIRNIKGYPHRCMWRGDDTSPVITHAYSTCTPDIKTCPDGICDSLEELHDLICPQDCTTQALVPLKLNPLTKKGIDSASGTVVCFNTNTCTLIPSKPRKLNNKNKSKHKPTLSSTAATLMAKNSSGSTEKFTVPGFHMSNCGTFCMLSIGTGLVLLSSIAIVITIVWRRSKRKRNLQKKFDNENRELAAPLALQSNRAVPDASPLSLNFQMTSAFGGYKRFEPDPKWEFPRSQLVIEQTLGEGEFGRVLRAKALDIKGRKGYTIVAVKTLKDDARESELNDLLSEFQLLKEVSHQNVIGLLGVCTSPGAPVYLIIEFAEYGSLRNYLRRSRKLYSENSTTANNYYDEPKTSNITSKDILSFAWQVCSGMAYLSDIKLVHRDLAARNVLLTSKKVCKISDFGLTRDIYEDNAYLKRSKGRVPVKWMAPESLSDHIYTTKSDVWSFGILIWELVTLGATPYPGIAVQNLFHLLRQGYRMEQPDNCSPGLYKIMRSCWHIDPEQRPSFQDLLKCWEQLLEDKMEYMNLSNSAVLNRSYFLSPFEKQPEEAVPEENIPEENSLNINPLNYLSNSGSLEKLQEMEQTINEEVKTILNKSNLGGYETPVKVQNPSRNDLEYTDMSGKEKQ